MRRVAEVQSCFVALPWHLLELLLTDADPPPSRLVLELRMSANLGGKPWYLAWGGAGAASSQIEVPEALAECIGLADGTRVHVRVLSDLSRASKVEIEPASEDDWEVLELNADYLEEQILNQVGVLHEGQRFPVWVQGQTILILHAVATAPRKLVQLVHGAELVVTPMTRRQKKVANSGKLESNVSIEDVSALPSEAWLRIQDLDPSLERHCLMRSVACTTSPTTVVFVDPQTAKAVGLKNKQLVIITSSQAGKQLQKVDSGSGKLDSQLHLGDSHSQGDDTVDNSSSRYAVVRICLRLGVAKGHIMMARALRLFIGARVHTRIRLQAVLDTSATSIPSCLVLSPVQFGAGHYDQGSGGAGASGSTRIAARSSQAGDEDINSGQSDSPAGSWSRHKDLLLAAVEDLSEEPHYVEKETGFGAAALLKCWLSAQVASGCSPPEEETQVPTAHRTIVHFSLGPLPDCHGEEYRLSEQVRVARTTNKRQYKDLFFVLVSQGSSLSSKPGQTIARLIEEKKGPQDKAFFLLTKLSPILDPNIMSNGDSQGAGVQKRVQVRLGRPQVAPWSSGMDMEENEVTDLASLTWLEGAASESISRLQVLLSPAYQENRSKFRFPVPGNVLLHGPPACGKTQLALALAHELKGDPAILAHTVVVRCPDLVGEQPQIIKVALQEAILEGSTHAPSLIIFDGLDSLFPSSESEGAEHGMTAVAIGEFLGDLMDISQRSVAAAAIAFLAVTRSPTALPPSLCCSGRFDCFVELTAPAARERAAILTQSVSARGFLCSIDVAARVAANCDGCDATDLDVIVDRAVHSATARYLSSNATVLQISSVKNEQLLLNNLRDNSQIRSLREITKMRAEQEKPETWSEKFELLQQDFVCALEDFVPAAMRGIAKKASQDEHVGWEDVGGLLETCHALREMLEMPVKHGKIFAEAPLRLRSGVLLFGPPGCGKTHIVGAAAAACSLRFISVKGPELLNKYIGASEQAVRDLFARAAAAAPCILFFDEFDAIAPRRGHDNTGVTDRVVNQLLTELDGVQALNGVFVFAATSRPDLLDAALLRPGRLDRLLFCDFPSSAERADILRILSRKLPLAEDVNIEYLAAITEGFSGADLQAVLSDAQLESIHSFLDNSDDGSVNRGTKKRPCITMRQLNETAMKARPSVTEAEKRKLNAVYDTFVGNRSISANSRDSKGKRATLA